MNLDERSLKTFKLSQILGGIELTECVHSVYLREGVLPQMPRRIRFKHANILFFNLALWYESKNGQKGKTSPLIARRGVRTKGAFSPKVHKSCDRELECSFSSFLDTQPVGLLI